MAGEADATPGTAGEKPLGSTFRQETVFALFVALVGGLGLGWGVAVATGLGLWAAALAGAAGAAVLYRLLSTRQRRARRLQSQPIPPDWEPTLKDFFPWFELLDEGERRAFLHQVRLFLREQRISAVDCQITPADRLVVGATAVFMVHGWGDFHYPTLREILIYPSAFDSETYEVDEEGDHIGQLLHAGPLILSLRDLRRGFASEDLSNVVVHEFAHYLDALVAPEAGSFASEYDPMAQRFLEDRKLRARIASSQSPLDDYALSDAQELFAVSSEVFFEDPQLLRDMHGDIYAWLKGFYRQDLASKLERVR